LIWHEDEPIAWPSSVALYFLAKFARQRVTVVLTGEGSDETLAGYARYALTSWNTRADKIYRTVTSAALRGLVRTGIQSERLGAVLRRKLGHTFLGHDSESWSSFYFDNFYSAFSGAEQSGLLSSRLRDKSRLAYAGATAFWEHSSGDLIQRLLYTDIKTYLVELLMKQDNMSMAASIESRVPFLDHVLVEFARSIPAHLSVKGLTGKHVLKEIAKDLLPESIVYRRKAGFPTPWSRWARGERLNQIEQMLTAPRSLDRDLFEPSAVRQLFAEHRAGTRDNADRIWRLLNLELWHQVFIDRDRAQVGLDDRLTLDNKIVS
jgi:asparagine synthase (glutamine-hydrolysing)